jgi:hypothetical protein
MALFFQSFGRNELGKLARLVLFCAWSLDKFVTRLTVEIFLPPI